MKKIFMILLVVAVCLSMAACASKEERLSADIANLENHVVELQTEISDLETEKKLLEDNIADIKIENGTAKYVVTLNIKQSHFTLDLGEHLKDEANALSIQIPVDKEYYDSLEIGDTIDDSFRMGSFIFKGSFGSWKITVENKEIK